MCHKVEPSGYGGKVSLRPRNNYHQFKYCIITRIYTPFPVDVLQYPECEVRFSTSGASNDYISLYYLRAKL